uniref:Uncharacterized protein n=1 Tax=Anguilla anguilla TaxID=7936 RepID=A0A0E9XW46_ANGAN
MIEFTRPAAPVTAEITPAMAEVQRAEDSEAAHDC